ncbi:copper amine oxidase N-terminal domain-containing protein [Paenibacillus sp.]|jgi:hypothetical protein|uniref:copper amine oxidase N-terminal domain-containing protein n=1 Tax=Paenibacillus sp. TaxID=58172 RepID=UPI002831E0B3|nr:copper amine oxidase N-terminal domain-containing protein [Paenibacillus sp.]MDR0267182.1 copper amine oxidase N-terminal domain-containing protein [Paenibacillus sp.]
MKKSSQVILFCLCTVIWLFPAINIASAETSPEPKVVINNFPLAASDVIFQNNQVYFSLTETKKLDNVTITWNNAAKQLSIKGVHTELLLTVNQVTAHKNGETIKLSAAPFIHNGKTMVPLRFVSEAFDSSVFWNSSTHTVFITKTSPKLIADVQSDSLSIARNAAINMPRVSQLTKSLEPNWETASIQYYFPKGAYDRFIEVNNNSIGYYLVSNNIAFLKWQALIGDQTNTQNNPYFIKRNLINETGILPSFDNTELACFRYMPHVGSTGYSLIQKDNWEDVIFKDASLPQARVNQNYIIVNIPEE